MIGRKEEKMRETTSGATCCLTNCTCTGAETANDSEAVVNLEEAQTVTDSLRKTLAVKIPEHLINPNLAKNGEKFSLAEVFKVLKRLSMQQGWQADYDYYFNELDGYPVVYARNTNGRHGKLLQHVKSDNTADGYFQLALLALMHDKFYLWWHAGYNKVTPIVAAGDMKTLPNEVVTKVKPLDLVPTVAKKPDGEVVVSICVFSEWDGVSKVPIHMKATFPHNPRPEMDGAEVLAPYDSGICY